MPKYVITLMSLTLVAIGFIVVLMVNVKIGDNEVKIFNAQFESYNKNRLSGSEIYSVINKAINNNQKEDVETHKVNINLRIIDYQEEVTVNMDKLNELGMDRFYEYYGGYEFRCTSIEYNRDTKLVEELNFENI